MEENFDKEENTNKTSNNVHSYQQQLMPKITMKNKDFIEINKELLTLRSNKNRSPTDMSDDEFIDSSRYKSNNHSRRYNTLHMI